MLPGGAALLLPEATAVFVGLSSTISITFLQVWLMLFPSAIEGQPPSRDQRF
jgi:hypothetical protein